MRCAAASRLKCPARRCQTEIEKAYADLGRAAKVPGFRPGRVPRHVLERMFGDRVRADVFGKLIQRSYAEVIEQQQIAAVGQPEIVTEQAEPGAPLRYKATVEVKPEVVADHYTGLEAERPLVPVERCRRRGGPRAPASIVRAAAADHRPRRRAGGRRA